MKIKNKISFYSFLMVLLFSASSKAQFVNNGNSLTIQNGAFLTVNGDFSNLAGTIQNFGELTVKGNWLNNDASGVFALASTGNTVLNGTDQSIGGSQKTNFPNLTLAGTGVKKLLTDADVRATLRLNNLEFAVEDKSLSVLGTAVGSIVYTTGFVSTNSKGFLYRHTNTADDYVFPLGSKLNGSLIYRPVTVKTKDNLDNTVGLSFVEKDPTTEGYDRSLKRFDVNEINPKYFYLADQKSGNSLLEYQFLFDKTVDGNFNQLVNWINFGLWEKAGVSNIRPLATAQPDMMLATFTTLKPVSKLPLTMSFITPVNDPITIFNSFSPDGDGKNDTWEIKNIDLFPDNEITILNRWGSEVFKAKNYNSANAWNGGGLNSGTYFYLLKVNINNEAKVYKGFITLLRND
ncbi:gliding motility-associated C-terminal domain-containing protein [Pedobacter arcticus]|uniref:gliding motility-associated C-terminal domain-containing protein n=1 Tax=Pedobacter arcticus TaxID=752140 RepID=UPI0002F33ADF|nr:gliding motility-associated C-terminal domain-containing protein [Pedobacter arcticus]